MYLLGVWLGAYYDWCYKLVAKMTKLKGALIWIVPSTMVVLSLAVVPIQLFILLYVANHALVPFALAHHNYWNGNDKSYS